MYVSPITLQGNASVCAFSSLCSGDGLDASSGSLSPRKSKGNLAGATEILLASSRNGDDGARTQMTGSSKEAGGMSPETGGVSAGSNTTPSPGNKGLPGEMM